MLTIIMLSDIMLSVANEFIMFLALCRMTICRVTFVLSVADYAVCHYDECRNAESCDITVLDLASITKIAQMLCLSLAR